MSTILWLLSLVFAVAGVVALVRGRAMLGAALVVLGLLVGPGGVSIFI